MKTFAFLSILVTILAAAAAARAQNNKSPKGVCPWPGDLDGVKVAPETHKVIFENEYVRVLEVTIPPHSKEPVHTHCLPSTLYFQQIGDIIVRDPDGKLIFDSRQMKENEKQKPPFVLWNAGEGPHSDENPDDVPIKIIQIENKDRSTPSGVKSDDVTTIRKNKTTERYSAILASPLATSRKNRGLL